MGKDGPFGRELVNVRRVRRVAGDREVVRPERGPHVIYGEKQNILRASRRRIQRVVRWGWWARWHQPRDRCLARHGERGAGVLLKEALVALVERPAVARSVRGARAAALLF